MARSVVMYVGVVLSMPLFTFAHAYGASLERTVGGILIDIGYSEEEIAVGEPVNFDFNVYDAATGEEIPYTDIWVRLQQERDIFFAGGIHRPSIGATTMVYQFAEPGVYTFAVRFQNDMESVAESEFTITVAESSSSAAAMTLVGAGVLALISGCVFAYAYRSKYLNRKNS